VATELFTAEHGRPPQDARELAAAIAKHSRPQTTAVAGYDLTFSPVKSVSTLWALADPAVAARIEKAHRAAVADALAFIEQHALFSRTGANGIRQVNVQGLVAAAFTHRDSRAGDPIAHPRRRRQQVKPWTDAGSASTAESCSKPRSPPRNLQHRPGQHLRGNLGLDSPNSLARTASSRYEIVGVPP
jgi:hypothetical protein